MLPQSKGSFLPSTMARRHKWPRLLLLGNKITI
jgi:hypothetical protein